MMRRGDVLYHQAKEAAWRDLPYLARGVMANLREHTFPDIQHAAAVRDTLRDPEYINEEQPLEERAKRFAQLLPSSWGSPREVEAVARLIRMRRAAGQDPFDQRAGSIYLDRRNAGQSEKRIDRARRASEHERNILYPNMASIRYWTGRLDHMSEPLQRVGIDHLDRMRRDRPVDADFLQRAGAKPVPHDHLAVINGALLNSLQRAGAKPVPQATGTRFDLSGAVDEPHYFRDGLKYTLVGTPGSKIPAHLAPGFGFNLGPAAIALAGSQPALAHELGHAKGLGALLTLPLYAGGARAGVHALSLPEEFRAQMRAQDTMRKWEESGVSEGLPAELAQMTPEQLKEHTIPLSTYADSAARQIANFGLDARDRLRRFKDRLMNRLR